jgi:hypothetical protein
MRATTITEAARRLKRAKAEYKCATTMHDRELALLNAGHAHPHRFARAALRRENAAKNLTYARSEYERLATEEHGHGNP